MATLGERRNSAATSFFKEKKVQVQAGSPATIWAQMCDPRNYLKSPIHLWNSETEKKKKKKNKRKCGPAQKQIPRDGCAGR